LIRFFHVEQSIKFRLFAQEQANGRMMARRSARYASIPLMHHHPGVFSHSHSEGTLHDVALPSSPALLFIFTDENNADQDKFPRAGHPFFY
jgi:hypothetical protein